ncbi:hypothetical protein [Pseudodesulfovibrio senegalensis]|uniref:DUF1643 domain-containing protein n=1 Tax=Pseudodesulfovibrio senegalensis TaxID=1721087 RepID=A0A6N6N7R5_9BACT|nr:hypothetical protein [Pseudodesulfovibrio senegalensis]KAB1443399.1 hypothetical protein F8A88_03840 [Pseudodesulfovibrio senegalensis]
MMIKRFYENSNHQLGWRFLNGSKNSLKNPLVALITLNPGGKTIPEGHSWESCENGSSYLVEKWKGSAKPGQANLQRQIQLLFEKIIAKGALSIDRDQLIEQSLCGYFVPFRSPRLIDLADKKQTFIFAEHLWGKVLSHVKPRLFVCIDPETHKRVSSLISSAYKAPKISTKTFQTNWGKITATLDRFGTEAPVHLLRLPHLSTFKLFTSDQCQDQLDLIFEEACSVLKN